MIDIIFVCFYASQCTSPNVQKYMNAITSTTTVQNTITR